MDFNETAKAIGFRDGDILISADGVPFERYDGDLLTSIVDARQVSVLRDGEAASVYIPEDMMNRLLADSVRFASFRFPYVVDSLIVGYPAASAGLQVGDSITHLDGKSIAYYDFKEEMLKRNKANASHEVTLTYVRNGVTDTLSMMTNADYEIGVAARTATDKLLPVVRKEYSFLSSFPAGVSLGVKTLKGYVGQMKYLFPALDGGHVLFLIYEIIARRKPSDKFMERAQMVGMFLLFGLLIWANFNDILRYFF